MLTRDSILAANDAALVAVEVPEWGGTVYVPVLSIEGVSSLQNGTKSAGDHTLAATVARITVDSEGKRYFTDEDTPALAKKPARVILRIVSAFNRANGLDADAVEKTKGESSGTVG